MFKISDSISANIGLAFSIRITLELATQLIGVVITSSPGSIPTVFNARCSGDKRPNETYFREDRAFIDAVLDRGDPLVSGKEGLRVLEVLEAIKGSVDSEGVIEYRMHEL